MRASSVFPSSCLRRLPRLPRLSFAAFASVAALAASAASAACGGSPTPPPEHASGDTSSLEGSSKDKDPDTKSMTPDSPTDAPSTPAAATKPAPSVAPAAAADDAPPAAAYHPAPSVTGSIDGKAFTPKVARVTSPVMKDGRIVINVTESSECPAAGEAPASSLMVTVPWQDGYKVDVSALKLGSKKGPPEIAFNRVVGGKKSTSATFKPSGTVTVVSAPTAKGATGKLKVDIQSGDYMLAGTLDVLVCVAPK